MTKPTTITKICANPTCQKEFTAPKHRESTAKTCSVECYRLVRRTDEVRTCQNPKCGHEYTASKAKLRDIGGSTSPGVKYCSRACRDEARCKRVDKVCEVCGVGYQVKRHRADRSYTCSPKCSGVRKSRRMAAGKQKNGYRHSYRGVFTDGRGRQHGYDSAWELLRIHQLEAMGVDWTRDHGVVIPYTDPDGVERSYVPDFFVDDLLEPWLEEVKPEWRVERAVAQAKFEAAEAHCQARGWAFKVLTEIELGVGSGGALSAPIGGVTRLSDLVPNNAKPPNGQKQSPAWQHQKAICRQYKKGATLNEVAESWGCSSKTISFVLRENGVEVRSRSVPKGSPGRRSKVWRHQKKMVSLREEGWSLAKIAKKYKTTSTTVKAILNDAGVDTSRRKK